jgi:hypothetical protein
MTKLENARMLLCGAMLATALPLAGCGSSPPVTNSTTTTTEESGPTPAPMQAPIVQAPVVPGAPGTVTTQTTHTQTQTNQ